MNTVVKNVVDKLYKTNKKICFAESLTGGMISETLVSVPGASLVFGFGFVTYSDEAKCSVLGVSEHCINEYGAVSYECAKEMAYGAYKKSGADISVSVTGFAGPKGDYDNEPVGTVYMGLCVNGKTDVLKMHIDGDRQSIRKKTTENVFLKLNEIL